MSGLVKYRAYQLVQLETRTTVTIPAPGIEVYKAEDVARVFEETIRTFTILRDSTYLDAEPPELRAQNERCHREVIRLLAELEEKP